MPPRCSNTSLFRRTMPLPITRTRELRFSVPQCSISGCMSTSLVKTQKIRAAWYMAAYVSIRQHTSAYLRFVDPQCSISGCMSTTSPALPTICVATRGICHGPVSLAICEISKSGRTDMSLLGNFEFPHKSDTTRPFVSLTLCENFLTLSHFM